MNKFFFSSILVVLLVACSNSGQNSSGKPPSSQQSSVSTQDVFASLRSQLERETVQSVPQGEDQLFGIAFGSPSLVTMTGDASLYDAKHDIYVFLDGDNRPRNSGEVPVMLFNFSDPTGREQVELYPRVMVAVEGGQGLLWKVSNFISPQYGTVSITTAIVAATANLSRLNLETDVSRWVSEQQHNSSWDNDAQVLKFWVTDGHIYTKAVGSETILEPETRPQLFSSEPVKSQDRSFIGGEGMISFSNVSEVQGMGGFVQVTVRVKLGRFASANNQLRSGWKPHIYVGFETSVQSQNYELTAVPGRRHVYERTMILPGVNRGYSFATIALDVSGSSIIWCKDQPFDSSYRSSLVGGGNGLTFHFLDESGNVRAVLGKPGE